MGGTVLNDEIVLVGGYNGGPKTEVFHWNPIEDTWSKGNDIGSIGHFDLTVEEINGSILGQVVTCLNTHTVLESVILTRF